MKEISEFPKWSKIWLFWADSKWDFTPYKENIPDSSIACEFTLNNDPFKCKIIKIVEEIR